MPRRHRFKHPSVLQEQRDQRAEQLRRAARRADMRQNADQPVDPMRDDRTMARLRGLLDSSELQPPRK